MIDHLRIQNFKSWRDTEEFRLASITAFFGSNSSGKTSLLQSLLALKQTAASFDRGRAFDFGEEGKEQDLVLLGGFQDVVHRHETASAVSIELNWQLHAPIQLGQSISASALTYKVEWRDVQGEVVVNDLQYRTDGLQFDLKRKDSSLPLYEWSLDRPGHPTPKQSVSSSPPDSCYGIPREFARTALDVDLLEFNHQFELLMDSIAYLGPLREYPHRSYAWTGAAPKTIDPRGRGAIEVLLAAQRQRTNGKAQSATPPMIERVAYWLRRFELADQFQLKPIDTEQRNYEARLQAHGSEANLSDVGFGVSQVLPIIVLLHFVPEDSIVILEQPEIHLHPRVQMDLADLFIEVAQTRHVQIIFESHSEHLLRRLQRRIAEESVTPDQAALYFCTLERGESHLSNLKLDAFGNITNWPPDFFGDDFGEIAAMSEAALARRAKQGGMRPAVVIDTNVAIVANGQTPQAGIGCERACLRSLKHIQAEGRVLLDRTGFILEEYRRYLSPLGQPGVGDAFFRWLWNNQANPQLCRQIPLIPLDEGPRQFAEFPDDPDLVGFDSSDQKFVAVALASGERPPILNASDTDWWICEAALTRHVQIEFICPELMIPRA